MAGPEHHSARQSPAARVVVGIDDSPASLTAVRWAARTAAARGRELLIAHGTNLRTTQALLGTYAVVEPEITAAIRTVGEGLVEAAADMAREIDSNLVVHTEVSAGHPAEMLIDLSASAHMVVLGGPTHRSVRDKLGSILLAVTSRSRGAVVVVRDDESRPDHWDDGPVVVGVDGSPISEAALGAAFEEAALRRAPLVVVHAWSDLYLSQFSGLIDTSVEAEQLQAAESEYLGGRLGQWRHKYPDVSVTRKVYLGSPTAQLMEWSQTARLVVVGSRGRGGFAGLLLGSTSNELVQRAHSPVMVVHPD